MKKPVIAGSLAIAFLSFALQSCATARPTQPSLFEAIAMAAERLAGDFPAGTSMAIVAFESESENFSRFIMDEFAGSLIDRGIDVPERQLLEIAARELDFHMTGYVSDETALSIGRFLGADIVIVGQLWDLGAMRRFTLNAIDVEAGTRASVPRFNVRDDRELRNMIAALGGPLTPMAVERFVGIDTFVRIEGGTFRMGSPAGTPDSWGNERPVRSVTVSTFHMSRHLVTQGEWHDIMRSNPSHFQRARVAAGANWRNLPVEMVSWFDALEFANRKSQRAGLTPAYSITGTGANRVATWNRNANGYRLPTEAEWEFAARGGHGSPGNFMFSGSNTISDVAWYGGNSGGGTRAVGTRQPNGLGLYDMTGNVWEWVYDWWGAYPNMAQTNPAGPAAGDYRVKRGGCWYFAPEYARSAIRGLGIPDVRGRHLGFRVVRP